MFPPEPLASLPVRRSRGTSTPPAGLAGRSDHGAPERFPAGHARCPRGSPLTAVDRRRRTHRARRRTRRERQGPRPPRSGRRRESLPLTSRLSAPTTATAPRTRLRQLARELNVADRVHLVGPLHHERVLAAFADADVVALASAHESFGMVAAEAASAGKPILLTDRCGVAELLGPDGALITPYDSEAIRVGLDTAARGSGAARSARCSSPPGIRGVVVGTGGRSADDGLRRGRPTNGRGVESSSRADTRHFRLRACCHGRPRGVVGPVPRSARKPSAARYGLHVLSPDSVVDRRRARGASTRDALLPRGLPTARRRARHRRPRRSVGDRRAQPRIPGAGDGVALGRPPSGPPARRDSDGDRVRAEPAVVHVGEVRRDAALGDRLLRARRSSLALLTIAAAEGDPRCWRAASRSRLPRAPCEPRASHLRRRSCSRSEHVVPVSWPRSRWSASHQSRSLRCRVTSMSSRRLAWRTHRSGRPRRPRPARDARSRDGQRARVEGRLRGRRSSLWSERARCLP